MKDKLSVRQAVQEVAEPVEKAGLEPGEIKWEIQ